MLAYDELRARTGGSSPGIEGVSDPRAASWAEIRRAARLADLHEPAVVIALLPPYYPQSPPRNAGLGSRLRPWLEGHGIGIEGFYPHISDASYLAWRGDDVADLAALLPGWDRTYCLPVAASAGLDLDVVTLGPWGRDAHGAFERVEQRFAFEVLPGLIAGAVRECVRA